MSSRQIRLIGLEAHARLREAEACVRSTGFAGVIEEKYLSGAGIRALSSEARELGSAEAFRDLDPAAREVAVGAMRALETVRGLLGI